MSTQPNPAQLIAFAMRDFVNERHPIESQVVPFLNSIGGLPTIFGLIVAIEDSLHLNLIRKVLARVFTDTPEGQARLLTHEVIQYLLAGLQATQPKHVRLISLQQTHLFIRFEAGIQRLLQPDLFGPLIGLLQDEDVEITEEIVRLLRKLGSTHIGLVQLFAPDSLNLLFGLTLENKSSTSTVDVHASDAKLMEPFIRLLQPQSNGSSSSSAGSSPVNSIVLLRVLTLLTQIACGIRFPVDAEGPKVMPDATHTPEQIREEAWQLYYQFGVFRLLLEISSIAPDHPHQDMLVQLNGLELLEEVVADCPKLDEIFSVQLTKEILDRAVVKIQAAATRSDKDISSSSLLPTSSFITVAVLRVFNRLGGVSASKSVHGWYHEPSFQLFLSAALNDYDDEAVQTEAIDLITTLASFEQGLEYFSTITSSLPTTTTPSKTSAYLSNPYASAVTPILLFQVPFFVYGTTYSNGLRQLSALHGMAKMLMTSYPDESDPSSLLRQFYQHLQKYNSNKSAGLDILLILARQPFEDIREAVWKVVLGLTKHSWGLGEIAHVGGFLEYLLDRKTEIHISGSAAKFDILRSISTSPAAKQHFSEASMKQVQDYIKQGVHYAPLTVGVMGPVSGARS